MKTVRRKSGEKITMMQQHLTEQHSTVDSRCPLWKNCENRPTFSI